MRIKNTLLIFLLFAFTIALLLRPLINFQGSFSPAAELKSGVLDVSSLDLDQVIYQLTGDIEIYPNTFIPMRGFYAEDIKYGAMPFTWKVSSGVTHASYRFNITGLTPGKLYGFHLMDALTAYDFYVNGEKIASLGVPSTEPQLTISEAKVKTAFFRPDTDTAEVVIHVSTNSSHLMGIWQKTLFGSASLIHQYEVASKRSDAFMIGAIFFMTLYLWILFFIMREDKAVLYFALACTFVTVKSLFAGHQLGFELYSFVNYDMGLRIAYLMIPGIAVSFMKFASECFRPLVTSRYEWFFYLASVIQAFLILLLPQRWYQETFIVYQLLIFVSAAMILFWALKGIWLHIEGAIIYTLGYIVFFVVAINDILYSMLLIKTGYYLSMGLFVLILSQAAVLAMRLHRALRTEAYLKLNMEQLVISRTQELESEKNKFENLSKVDSLTHLFNKGYLMETLQIELEGYKRYNGALSILMIDLDLFKIVNDTYGHMIGDEVLKKVSEVLIEHSRRSDIVGRFGGEEFLIILRFTSLEDAMRHAEQLRKQVEAIEFSFPAGGFGITASFGVAAVHDGILDEKQLIHEADEALYQAKENGRNRVVSSKEIKR